MRADIHDGRELELQTETGYIDARPYCQIDETSCTARPDHTLGSIASFRTRSPDVCLSPDSGARADISGPQLRATDGRGIADVRTTGRASVPCRSLQSFQ